MSVDQLGAEISKALDEYSAEVTCALEETKKELAKQSVKKLKASSPRRTGKYAAGWTKRKKGNAIVVHNKVK